MPNNSPINELVNWFSSGFKKVKKEHNVKNAQKRGVSPAENKSPKENNKKHGGSRRRRTHKRRG
jgi:hypothetical protein